MSYIAASDVLTWGEFDGSASDVVILSTLIPQVQTVIENYTRRVFEGDSDSVATHYFTVNRDTEGSVLLLDEDLCNIVSVTIGTTSITAYVPEPRNTTPYSALRLKDNAPQTWGHESATDGAYDDAIQVSGNWCYSLTPPGDIKLAAIRLTMWAYQLRTAPPDNDRAIVTGSALIFPSKWPKDVIDMLAPYKKPVVI